MQVKHCQGDGLVKQFDKLNTMLKNLKEVSSQTESISKNVTECVNSTFSKTLSAAINQVEDLCLILEKSFPFNCQTNVKKEIIFSGFIREGIREIKQGMNIDAVHSVMRKAMLTVDATQNVQEIIQELSIGDVCFIKVFTEPLLQYRCNFLSSQHDLHSFHVYYSYNEINQKRKRIGRMLRFYSDEISSVLLGKLRCQTN